ncbi:MAG: serine/threonine protein kinase, partial [Mycobacteriales bacterium]
PNVVGLRGVRSDETGLVLVLERAARSLTELVGAHGVLSAGATVGVLAPIAQALGQAHARGILHGDISPGNILLRADGTPLLADLGTARLAALCGASSSPIVGSGVYGTSGFSDPALRHNGEFTDASDVYALGAVAAYSLVGERLGDAPEAVQAWANRAHQLAVPPALAAAVCAVLVSPPASRPTAEAFASVLREACPVVTLSPADIRAPTASPVAAYDAAPDPIVGAVEKTRQVHVRDHGTTAPSPTSKWRSWLRLGRLHVPRQRRAHRTLRRHRLATLRHAYGTPGYFAAIAARQRRITALRGAAVLVFIVGIGLGGGAAWAALGGETSGSKASAPPATRSLASRAPADVAADRWRGVLEALDSDRARSFETLDVTALERVYAPASPMLRADREQIVRLRSSDTAATGLRHKFRAVHVFAQTEDRALVQASEQLQEHRIVRRTATVDSAGLGESPVITVPSSEPRTVQIVLTKVNGAWRISAVTPV